MTGIFTRSVMLQLLRLLVALLTVHGAHSASLRLQADKALSEEDDRIVGGQTTSIRVVPYQIALFEYNTFICGGSLASYELVLTAAHCTQPLTANALFVRAGTGSLTLLSTVGLDLGVTREVAYKVEHPKYNAATYDYDVAVIVLRRSVPSGQPNMMPIQLITQPVANGVNGRVSGWGKMSENGATSDVLRSVLVPKQPQQLCINNYQNTNTPVTSREVCFGYVQGGKDACQGDSGGPLAVGGKLAGIVSFGKGCAQPKFFGVYVDVCHPEIRTFINYVTGLKTVCSNTCSTICP